jgi:hypothetical protein
MKPPILRLLWLLSAAAASAATHAVLPGEAIQPKIDAAAPGDIIAIFGGTYPGDVTINKAVRLVEVDGQEVTITGNVTWNNVTDAPPFEGFTVGSAGKGITVNNTTRLAIKNVDARPGFGVRVVGSSVVNVVNGFYSKVYQDGGELSAIDAQVTGDFETTTNCLKTVALQMNVANNYTWGSRRAWCGYSKGKRFTYNGNNSYINIIGCELDIENFIVYGDQYQSNFGNTGYHENYPLRISGSGNKIGILNNKILRVAYAHLRHSNQSYPFVHTLARGIGVYGNNHVMIANNYVELNRITWNDVGSHTNSYGIIVDSASAKIFNNIVEGPIYGISAPFGADVRNNCTNRIIGVVSTGGHVPIGSLNTDPIFVVDERPRLQEVSPCINAGVSDPIFNDLDGTRNDIGPSGGCLFDPDGWTTNKPVVIAFDLDPQQLLKGVDTQVTISSGQAVAQP